jgi:hypothetical protein
MFFKKDRELLVLVEHLKAKVEMLEHLEHVASAHQKILFDHAKSINLLLEASYGLRKDRTPKAKPGRKSKVQA